MGKHNPERSACHPERMPVILSVAKDLARRTSVILSVAKDLARRTQSSFAEFTLSAAHGLSMTARTPLK